MSQHRLHTTGFLRSLDGTFGEIQVVATGSRVVLDVTARNYDVAGYLHRDSSLSNLSVGDAIRLRDLLDEAIVAAADAPPHNPGVWSDATTRAVARRVGRRAA